MSSTTATESKAETLLAQVERLVNSVSRLSAEIDRLKAENEDLRRYLSPDVKKVLARLPCQPGKEPAILASVCRDWLRRSEHDRKIVELAAKTKHAGLDYLATELNWLDVLANYGGNGQEAAELIERLMHCRDRCEVNQAIRDLEE